ncbi:hypothetical protein D3C73_1247250 [compost metagenome]
MNFDLAPYAADFLGRFVDLGVGGIEFFVDALLATLLDPFTGFYQLLKVVRTPLTNTGVSADACQPDLARVAAHLAQRALGVILFLHIHFGHALYLMLMSGGRNRPWRLGLSIR